jgi:phosphoserine aminotransferase
MMAVLLWLTAIGGVQQLEQATKKEFSQRFWASKP